MLDVRKLLAQRPLLFDGGMGTYYKAKPGQECEQANLTDPEGILAVHRAYLAAGADAIKTNTFSLPRLAAAQQPGWEQLADAGWQLAAKAAGETGAAVFADLGPAPDTENLPAEQVYLAVAKRFALLGARNFLFETLSAEDGVLEAIRALKQTVPEAFVLVSFAVLPDGYTREGRYCAELVRRVAQSGVVDAVGLNCVSAPGAMRALVQQLGDAGLPLSVMPNAGYPVVARAQVRYQGKPEYFARELSRLAAEGVREILAITGDPIPTAERDEVKNVYQFNSRKLAQYIVSLAGEGREMPASITVFGALNLNARNFEVELRRAAEKLENGMSGFLTQPVLSAQAVENLKKARETLGERAKILAGILPVVSQRNAIFMENEVNGIHVDDAIIQKFEGLDRAAGEELGLEVSVQAAKAAAPYADGFYLMTPFNRVALMERLIARLRTEVTD